MEKNYIDAKVDAIQKRAEHEIAGVRFLQGVLAEHYDQLKTIFSDEMPSDVEEEAYLYDELESMLRGLDHDETRVSGNELYNIPVKGHVPTNPAEIMGWARFIRVEDELIEGIERQSYVSVRGATQQGLQLLNEWRAALGYVDISEQKKINRERKFGSAVLRNK